MDGIYGSNQTTRTTTMIRQDYFLRLLREFFEALQLVLRSKTDIRQKKDDLNRMYDEYVGDSIFYHTAPMDEIVTSFQQYEDDMRYQKMEMLAYLYSVEAMYSGCIDKAMMQERALWLFTYVNKNSKEFSLDRQKKIDELQKELANIVKR